MVVIGIDPGVTTGIASWCTITKRLGMVESRKLHEMLLSFRDYKPELVIFEDCRQHRMYGPGQRNDAALQGVGSVKRDCGIWDEFLTDQRIPFVTRTPSRRRTKFSAEQFQAATGWTERSNNHGRDAAMLVAGLNEAMAQAMVREWQQRRAA